MDEIEAADLIRKSLSSYGDGFSIRFDIRRRELQAVVERGKTVAVLLIPERRIVVVGFHRFDGIEASLKVEEDSLEKLVDTAVITVASLLEIKTPR